MFQASLENLRPGGPGSRSALPCHLRYTPTRDGETALADDLIVSDGRGGTAMQLVTAAHPAGRQGGAL